MRREERSESAGQQEQASPTTSTPGGGRQSLGDAFSRLAVSLLLGALGFWLPAWYDWRIQDSDSRFGVIFLVTLPIIFVYAAQGTRSLWNVYRNGHLGQWMLPVLLLCALAVLCWLPVLVVAFGIIRACLQSV